MPKYYRAVELIYPGDDVELKEKPNKIGKCQNTSNEGYLGVLGIKERTHALQPGEKVRATYIVKTNFTKPVSDSISTQKENVEKEEPQDFKASLNEEDPPGL